MSRMAEEKNYSWERIVPVGDGIERCLDSIKEVNFSALGVSGVMSIEVEVFALR